MRAKTKNNKKLIIITTLVVLLGVIAAYMLIASEKSWWPYTQPLSNAALPSEKDPNTPDPTYPNAKNNPRQESSTDTAADEKKPVTVAISYAGMSQDGETVEIRAFISGVIEGSGTCTATLTQGDNTITQSSRAFIDATTSQCEPIQVDRSKLSNGEWQLAVHYSSPTSNGDSQSQVVKI